MKGCYYKVMSTIYIVINCYMFTGGNRSPPREGYKLEISPYGMRVGSVPSQHIKLYFYWKFASTIRKCDPPVDLDVLLSIVMSSNHQLPGLKLEFSPYYEYKSIINFTRTRRPESI